MLARVILVLLAVALVLPVSSGMDLADAKKRKRFKNVTRTFSNTALIDIPGQGEAMPYPAIIQVGGFKKGKIKDVDVTLRDISHTVPDQIDVLLVAPGGRNTLLMSDTGGNDQVDNITLTLDDQAAAALPLVSQLETGTFRPTNDGPIEDFPDAPETGQTVALSVFNGQNPNGVWQVFVIDDNAQDNGEIAGGVSLEITAKVKKKKKRR